MFHTFLGRADQREYQAAIVLLERLAEQHRAEGAVIQEISNWTLVDPQIKSNEGRMCIKRYLAILANEELREYLFGHSIDGEWQVKPVRYWEGRTPPDSYYASVSPYDPPPQWHIDLGALSRYARQMGKDIIDLTYDEVHQFETKPTEVDTQKGENNDA